MQLARKFGIKVIGLLHILSSGEQLLRAIKDEKKIQAFSKSAIKIFDELKLDGMFLYWQWPGCPTVSSLFRYYFCYS